MFAGEFLFEFFFDVMVDVDVEFESGAGVGRVCGYSVGRVVYICN